MTMSAPVLTDKRNQAGDQTLAACEGKSIHDEALLFNNQFPQVGANGHLRMPTSP